MSYVYTNYIDVLYYTKYLVYKGINHHVYNVVEAWGLSILIILEKMNLKTVSFVEQYSPKSNQYQFMWNASAKFVQHSDRHFPKIVKSSSGHTKTCKFSKNWNSKIFEISILSAYEQRRK